METQWSAVRAQMTVDIVAEHTTKLFSSSDVCTRIDHMTTGQGFVEGRVITTIELVNDHLPNRVAAAGTILGIADTFVRHTEIERVWPDGNAAKRGSDGRIVDEELISHHVELLVATNTQIRSSNTNNRAVGDVGESFNDQSVSSHFSQPIIIRTISPVFRTVLASDGERSNLVSTTVKVLYSRVVGVFVRNKEGTCKQRCISREIQSDNERGKQSYL